MTTKDLTRCEIEEIVINNASRFAEYRRMLVKDPKRTLEMQMNNRLPDNVSVELLEETPTRFFVRLPYNLENGAELSDDDLEDIAGGKGKSGNHYACNEKPGGFNTRNEFNVSV
ncbi:MAG: hypothetical protein ACI9R3_002333 [Verrucomicrobiales bacterium]|jgi:hypothetical protein